MVNRPRIQIDTDKLLEKALTLHQRIYVRSGGRIGARAGGVSCLLLRTTGRRSGEIRTAALAYAKDGEEYVLVASNNGHDAPPQWLENLRHNPKVAIQVGPEHYRGTAKVIERGTPDYERLLRIANANNFWRYFHYQEKTTRPIPVVIVSPDDADSA